ncbi:MAG: FAD-dependent oxidoreductase [Pseudomonadales bacterium]|nr:FAD-dependent oxidoreductase [Pseudomonadales bacterium]NIX07475.1 FAD-dependent oxidoreductase [Pseudomonadales bacterium]
MRDVAIVGAGIAGCVCASALHQQGLSVVVLEKSGDIGGRLATRRRADGRWNHGTPDLASRSPAFRRFLNSLETAGAAEREEDAADHSLHVGLPDMRGLLRPLVTDIPMVFKAQARRLARCESGWIIESPSGAQGPFQAVVLAIPAPQASALLEDSGLDNTPSPTAVTMTPVWTLMLGFAEPRPIPARADPRIVERLIPQARRADDPPQWYPQRWVAHATARWSRANVDLDPADAAERMLRALDPALAGTSSGGPDVVMAHRWRFASTASPLGRSHLWDPQQSLGLAGDWCLGATAEDAFASGNALARAVSQSLITGQDQASIDA